MAVTKNDTKKKKSHFLLCNFWANKNVIRMQKSHPVVLGEILIASQWSHGEI